MTDREKLIELFMQGKIVPFCKTRTLAGIVADNLIANGVTMQKLDGCKYCQQFDDPCGVPMIAKEDSEPDRGIYLYNGYLCADGGEFCEAKVDFCPMCGRALSQPLK